RFHRALAELMALPEEHPLVRRVRKVVVAFWDPIVQDLTRSGDMNALQKVESLYAAWEQRTLDEGRKEGIKEGRKEGIKEGQQELLLKLLTLKFGQLAEGVEQRVLAADAAALDRWAAQVLVADSLDDVFAEP
uniref:DUF4351 domain-containing protein n=1 Tax=Haliangium sp. TaxID=2663208 RepID=UPI003D0E2443